MTCYIDQMLAWRALLITAVCGGTFLAVCLVFWLGVVEQGVVARSRVESFARRQHLAITAGNGNHVIRYLATTRRWRATGIMLGLIGSVAWALREGGFRIDFLALFAGWFVGALVAEFRLARVPRGPRRAASLTRRTGSAYLPGVLWALVPAAALASLAVGGWTLVEVLRGRSVDPLAGVLCGVALAVAVTVILVQRQVLHRGQSAEAADLVAADNAIRSRSLHVLAGAGMSVIGYCVLGQLTAMATNPDSGILLGYVAVPVLGWLVAAPQWRVAR